MWRAWGQVRANNGASGIDQITLTDVEEYGVTGLLGELEAELKAGAYRPLPARRVFIPKPGSDERRPLSIPTVTAKRPAFWRVFGCGADCSCVPCAVRPSIAGVVRQASRA